MVWPKGKPCPPETRRKISESQRGGTKPGTSEKLTGRKRPAEVCQKMSESMTGRVFTDEWVAKLTEANRKNGLKPEVRAKMSVAAQRRCADPEYRQILTDRMNSLRPANFKSRTPSSIESLAYRALESLGIAFEREHPLGRYFADVFIPALNLDIECDGVYWHGKHAKPGFDAERDAWLTGQGYRVVRLTEAELKADPVGAIKRALA